MVIIPAKRKRRMIYMKKVLSLVMAFVLVFGLAACGSKPAEEKKDEVKK